MAASTARNCSSWPDLRPELLGLVLGRLPSLADRVRLAAVCRPWRHVARIEPVPPPFPWVILRDGTFLSITDGKIHRLPWVPPDYSRCLGSVGNWLFLEQNYGVAWGSQQLSLMNAFSKNVVQLPDAHTMYRSPCILIKLVLLSSTAMDLSPDSLFAALITDDYKFVNMIISICQPSTASALHVPDEGQGQECFIIDVECVDGKLYVLSPSKLFVLEVESSGECKPKISSVKCIATNDVIHQTIASEERICECFSFLLESNGKLLLVTRFIGGLSVSPGEDQTEFCHTFSFAVFEVDLTTSSSVQWRRLSSLEGKAIFVGPYSKALHASEYGAQADCIYFMCNHGWGDCPDDPFCDSGVFNLTNETITPLLPKTMMPEGIANGRPAHKFYSGYPLWFFPY